MKQIILITSLLLFSNSFAKSEKEVMSEVATSVVKLIPYISDVKKFKDPSNEKMIKDRLQYILKAFQSSKKGKRISRPEFQASYKVMIEHLDETIQSFDTDHKEFAYKKLRATGQLCMSCHNMVKGDKKGFVRAMNKVKGSDFASTFDYAEFLYLTRDYRKADRNYRKWTDHVTSKITAKNSLADDLVYKAAIKVMTINLAVYFTPKRARSYIDRTLQNKNLTPALKEELKDWNETLVKWMQWKRPSKISKEFLTEFINTKLIPLESEGEIISDAKILPILLISKGLMDQYLKTAKRDEMVATAMYWKAVSERLVGFSYFYSLADMQLRTCITDFPKSKVAKKCYKEFERQVVIGYSGSGGVNIPEDVKAELTRLKSLISQ
jgi:hypothetical protein